MSNYEIILLIMTGLIGFWLFSLACMFAKFTKHFEEQSTAIILMIATMLNKKGEKDNDTTGKTNH